MLFEVRQTAAVTGAAKGNSSHEMPSLRSPGQRVWSLEHTTSAGRIQALSHRLAVLLGAMSESLSRFVCGLAERDKGGSHAERHRH